MQQFVTILKEVTHKTKRTKKQFYSEEAYNSWKGGDDYKLDASSWSTKHFKGVGSNSAEEAKKYLDQIDTHTREYVWDNKADEAIDFAFRGEGKKGPRERNEFIKKFELGTFLDLEKRDRIKYSDFIYKELVHYWRASLLRSIPSIVDCLKPSHRKIIFSSFKSNFTTEVKISQLIGSVMEKTAYHHGEDSLAGAAIRMARNYVGTNNVNILVPSGQFGSRNEGGEEHAQSRYMYTMLAPMSRLLFPKVDDNLLEYLDEDGSIKPRWYLPIIPPVLINGCIGIGTGSSTCIPSYHPRDIIDNLQRKLEGQDMLPMHPWYRGFKGKVVKETGTSSYIISGLVKKVTETEWEIHELPPQQTIGGYREILRNHASVERFTEWGNSVKVGFTVHLSQRFRDKMIKDGKKETEQQVPYVLNELKLISRLSTNNMHLFDRHGVLQKYESPEAILEAFYDIRVGFFSKRRKFQLRQQQDEKSMIENKIRFVKEYGKRDFCLQKDMDCTMETLLQRKGFTPFPRKTKGDETGYEYLYEDMHKCSLSKLEAQCDIVDRDYRVLERDKDPKNLWASDLAALKYKLVELKYIPAKREGQKNKSKRR